MGKWNRRRYTPWPRRRNYQNYDWSPPRDEPCPDPETEDWQDNVPLWEKKFCYLVGRMSWKKVLSTKNFMHCHSNVLSWDDSAGEEAFLTAKKGFWDEFNGLPCETQLPNPDMYIDEIDWNPYIDPELAMDVDRTYFNPDDKYYLPSSYSSKGNNGWGDDVDNPWERGYAQVSTAKDKATGWNQWDKSVNDSRNLNKVDDPWDSQQTQNNEVVKENTWEGAWHKSFAPKSQNQSNMSKNWSAGGNAWRNEGKRWQDCGATSRSGNQKSGDFHKPHYQNNNYKPQEYGFNKGSRMPNGGGNSWGQRQSDSYNWEAKDNRNVSGGRGHFNVGCRKREGPDQYETNNKGPRIYSGDSQSSRYWNGCNNKRVSFGGQWS